MGIKIAVYTIALNEEKHVKRWFDSAKDADLLLIADTGSTDSTKFIAKSLGIQVYEIEVNPWRFDVARNASLSLIPENFDMCVQLDMDEVLSSNWRAQVEKAFLHGNLWPTYKHVTVRNQAGDPRNFQLYFKIHPRNGFKWEYPIHEILTPTDKTQKYTREFISLEVDHLKDNSKSRKSYLGLLQTAVSESPNDWRMNHYLNREYFYIRDWLKVLQTGYKCSALPGGWNVERASTYMWMSEAARWLELMPLAKYWAERATDSAPEFYEAWHWRAHIAHLLNDWTECLESAQKIEELSRQSHHLVKPEVWEWWGYDLIALSSHKLGLDSQAVLFGEKAFFANPGDERLKKNLDFYRKELPYKKDSTFHLNLSQKLIDFPKM